MENGNFEICDEPVIVEDLLESKEDEAKEDASIGAHSTSKKKNLFGCCLRSSSADKTSETISDPSAVDTESPQFFQGCAVEAKSFLSSSVCYIFVIVVAFSVFLILFVELFIDTGYFHAGDGEDSLEEARRISVALHWFSFAILSGFFIEILFRLIAWRMALAKDFVAIFDSLVVVIAFTANLCATLIAVKIDLSTKKFKYHTKKAEEELVTANFKITALHRRIEEKDYEIRQLQAHLGNEMPNDHELMKAIHSSKTKEDSKGAAADADLEMAIALSKRSYEDRFGVVNKAFSLSHVEERNASVIVHQRPNRMDSDELDIVEAPKVASYIDEYFSKPGYLDGSSSLNSKSGAIPKKKGMNLFMKTNLNDNNNSKTSSSLQVLQIDESSNEPITVFIDPSILKCESPVSNEGDLSNIRPKSPSQDASRKVELEIGLPPSDVGSSDDCIQDIFTAEIDGGHGEEPMKTWQKQCDSSVSSESGYLSEGSSRKKQLKAVATINPINSREMESSAL